MMLSNMNWRQDTQIGQLYAMNENNPRRKLTMQHPFIGHSMNQSYQMALAQTKTLTIVFLVRIE